MAAIAAFAVAFQFIASHPLSAADEIVEYAPVLRPPIIGPPVVLRPDYLTEPTAIASADQLPEQAIPLDSAEATPEDQKLVQVSDEAVQIDPPDATSVGAEGAAPGLGIHRYPYATTDGPELQDSGATGGSRVAPPPKRPESIAARTAESLPPPRPDYISNTRRRVVRSAAFGELQMGPPPRPANLAAYAAVAAAHSSSKQKDQKAYETVASHATQNGALKNARLVLIGIVGKPGQAKALVRLRGGSLVSLSVGDKLNGGRIKSIQRDHLIYTRGDSTRRLAMPD